MTQTTENQTTAPVDENAELGFGAMLLAEGEGGGYEPIGIVSTISEARDIADADFENRMAACAKGEEPLYPARYVVWARGDRGTYRTILAFEAD
jgi:hypothetical protein